MDFSEYVDARRTTLVRAAVLLGHSMPEAEELVQATLTEAFRTWQRIQRGDDIDSDVYRILISTANDPPFQDDAWAPEPFDSAESRPGMTARRAVAEMPRQEREIVVLRYFLDLSEVTTAQLLSLPAGAARVADEPQARTLVQEASETIDVAALPFVPTPRARRVPWFGFVAAGAVVLVGLGILFGWFASEDPRPDDSQDKDRQVPVVFGYSAESARELLEAQGWEVTDVDSLSCEPAGRALATVPQAGATPTATPLKLLVSVPADGLGCNVDEGSRPVDRALAWQVLDFARDREPLTFTDQVLVVVNGRQERASADEALRRNTSLMQDLIRVLAEDAKAVRVEGGTWTTPLLTTKMDPGDSQCAGLDLPTALAKRESLLMYVALPAFNTAPTDECHFLNVYSTAGVIDALVLRTGLTTTPDGRSGAVPDVVGLDKKVARATLRSDGFKVQTEKSDGCPGNTVLEQVPEAGVIAEYGSQVRLEIGREAANTCL